jgi:hypothetical protein
MKFNETELLPGVVIDVNDPKKLGRVKATVPTLFDEAVMNREGMPWIYPLTMTGYQGFSKLMAGSKIWVFKQQSKPREFWYIPMFELNQNTRTVLENYEEPEVLISRSAGDESIYIYYTDQEGIMLKFGESNFINIKPDSSITLRASESKVELKNGKVYIGDGNATEPAVLGNKLFDALNNLSNGLNNVASMCNTPWTLPLRTPLQEMSASLLDDIQSIRCEFTVNN